MVAADLTAAYGPGWQERLVAFDDTTAAAASIGQVHRGKWRIDGGQVVVAQPIRLGAQLDVRLLLRRRQRPAALAPDGEVVQPRAGAARAGPARARKPAIRVRTTVRTLRMLLPCDGGGV